MSLKIVLVRHGQSLWNQENRFTGWKDIDLSNQGIEEAKAAGQLLKNSSFEFDIAFTSYLQRAIKTLNIILDESSQTWLPVHKTWRLNERHYGDLEGLNKSETAQKFGEQQVKIWRRSYDTPPPAITPQDKRYPGNDRRYKNVASADIPLSECLKDTVNRFLPYWHEMILPQIKKQQRVLIVAHGNSLRALIQYLDKMSPEEILNLDIPTGMPIVYELNEQGEPLKHYYLGNAEEIQKAIDKVAHQGKV